MFVCAPTELRGDPLRLQMADEDVAIVKMDATANDVPPAFEVRGFPTLFFLPKDSKSKPQSYEVSTAASCLLGF